MNTNKTQLFHFVEGVDTTSFVKCIEVEKAGGITVEPNQLSKKCLGSIYETSERGTLKINDVEHVLFYHAVNSAVKDYQKYKTAELETQIVKWAKVKEDGSGEFYRGAIVANDECEEVDNIIKLNIKVSPQDAPIIFFNEEDFKTKYKAQYAEEAPTFPDGTFPATI